MKTEHEATSKHPMTGKIMDDENEMTNYGEKFPDKTESEDGVYDILIVDDETQILRLLKDSLKASKNFEFDVTLATDGEYGIKHITEQNYDMVLSDYDMPNMNGVEFLKKVKEESPNTVRIMITGQADLDVAKEAINEADISHFIEKPWDTQELLSKIREELRGKKEEETDERWISDVEGVAEAIETVEDIQKRLTKDPEMALKKEMMMVEFNSNEEFNNFSFQIKNLNNIEIEDVNIFQNKYVLTVGILPKTLQTIK